MEFELSEGDGLFYPLNYGGASIISSGSLANLCHNTAMRPLIGLLACVLCSLALPAQAELEPLVDVASETEIINLSSSVGDQPAYACVRMFFGLGKDRRSWQVRAQQEDCPQTPYCALQLWLGSMYADGGSETLNRPGIPGDPFL